MEDVAAAMITRSYAFMKFSGTPHRFLACAMFGVLLWASGSAQAGTNLNPFAGPTKQSLLPFQVSQAEEAPASAPAQPSPTPKSIASPSTPTPKAQSTTALQCTRDEECKEGTICNWGTCQAFERTLDILLYRQTGPKTAFLPFYWSRQGNPGYRILAPLYFHTWDAITHYRIVAPFYWRFEDYLKQRVVLVIPPYSQTTEPNARSFAVWPIFYYSTKFGWAAPLLLSFALGNPDKGTSFGMATPLCFWKRSEKSAFSWIFPLNFYWRSEEDRNLLTLPLFYRNTHPSGGTLATVLGYSSVDKEATTGSFLWLYWYGRVKSSNFDVLFPLLWSFRSPNSNFTLLPPVFHYRDAGYTLGSAGLLAWWGRDDTKGSNWQLVPPFLFRSVSNFGKKAYYLWPFGSYSRNDDAQSRHLTMLLPPILHHRDPSGSLDFDLLYYRRVNALTNTHTTLAWLYYHREDPAGSTRAILPLYWQYSDARSGATAHTLLPFYFRRNAPDETLTAGGLFPVWFYSRSFRDGGSSAGLFPLAFFGSRGSRSHAIVFPLFWRFRDEKTASTLLFPVFYNAYGPDHSNTTIFPLLYFQGQQSERRYRFQIPFYFHVADDALKTATTVVPPLFFHHRTAHGSAAGILPFVYWGSGPTKRHVAFFPLFWYFRDDVQDRTTTVVANYLHRRHGTEVTDALFPLFHYRRGARPGGSEEFSLTLFPFFHQNRNANRTIFASPLGAWTRSKERQLGFLGPYVWYRSSTVAAQGIPLLFLDHTQLDTQKRTRMWGPVVAIDTPHQTARIVFPFWGRYQSSTEEGTYVFPTFFRRHTRDGYHLTTLFPFYWRSRWPTGHTSVYGPYFSHSSTDNTSSGLLPFYVSSKSKQRDWFISPLWIRKKNHETQTQTDVSLLYYASSKPDSGFRLILPLWWQSWNRNQKTTIGFPLYWHFANTQTKSQNTLIGPYYSARNDTERTQGLLPFFWYSHDPIQHHSSLGLLPLFYSGRTAQTRTFLTLPFGFKTAPDKTTFYVGNFVWHDTWKSRFHTFFPLYLSFTNKAAEKKTLVVPLLFYYAQTTPERSFQTLAMLFWRKTTVTSSLTMGIPFYFDFHDYYQSRFTMALPLFAHYRNEESKQSYTLAPLFYRRTGPTDSTTIGFPLYWRFASEERSTTVFFPFYVGIRRPTWNMHYVFPNIYYRKGLGAEAGTSHLFIFPFWESQIKRPGDYMWETLLGIVGWERIGRNRFLKLLFIPFELEPAPAAKTAWYGKPLRQERTARSLDVRTW
jgi:hypothetical protein